MAIYDENDKIQKWKYKVKEIKILINGDSIKIPTERLNSLTIIDDYINNLYPIFQIQMVLASNTFYKIQENKNNLKLFLRIDKMYYYDDKSKKADDTKISCSRLWINDTFDILMDDDTGNINSSLEREENKNSYEKIKKDNTDDLTKVDNGVTFYLYKTISELKTNVNKIFTGINVSDAIAYLMTVAGLSNVVMQQPDNKQIYDTFVIPPLSISKALYWIDTYYGIYEYGTIFFADLHYFYIIPFDGKNRTAFIDGDTKITYFIIPSSGSSNHSNESGVLKKQSVSGNYIVAEASSLSISNSSISNDLINGSDSVTIDAYSGDSSSASSNAKTKSENKTKTVTTNFTENNFYTTMKTALSKSLSTVINFTAVDYDISMIKPNKTFSMLFEDSTYTNKYKGKYTITNCTHSFIKEGDSLALQSQITLKKMD